MAPCAGPRLAPIKHEKTRPLTPSCYGPSRRARRVVIHVPGRALQTLQATPWGLSPRFCHPPPGAQTPLHCYKGGLAARKEMAWNTLSSQLRG